MQDLRRYYDKENKKFFYSGWHFDENNNKYYKSLPDFALRKKMIGDSCSTLKDQNDNLIFEKDILRFDAEIKDGNYAKVYFKNGAFYVDEYIKCCKNNPMTFYLYDYLKLHHTCKIIGNLH